MMSKGYVELDPGVLLSLVDLLTRWKSGKYTLVRSDQAVPQATVPLQLSDLWYLLGREDS
jgi:hypothetical protein